MGLFDSATESAKILLLGDQGAGKTGAKAALVAAGYKLRMIDVDRGAKILRSLLTDPHYPYAAYMKRHGIDPTEPGRISVIPIDVPIGESTVTISRDGKRQNYTVLGPTSSAAWSEVINLLLKKWVDPDGLDLGQFTDWGSDEILDIDTLSTLAELAKYSMQGMNGRLGALEDDHGRDTGAAQELANRLAMKVTSPLVKCNVIVTTHVNRADIDRGAPLSPEQLLRQNKSVNPRGFPAIIGRAAGPIYGKRWNDQYVVKDRKIYTEEVDNIAAKHSVWLEPSYPLSTGLAQIFAALQFKELPEDFVPSIGGTLESSKPSVESLPSGFSRAGGGFRSPV